MAWADSRIFIAAVTATLNRTATAIDLDADAFKVALFDNSITPDRTVSGANSAYAAGVWASGGVADATGWPAAGRSLVSVTSTATAGVHTFDAADTASANATTTLAGTFGCLVYDDTATSPADEGVSFNYFGGTQSVTSGTFTIIWNASGIFAITV